MNPIGETVFKLATGILILLWWGIRVYFQLGQTKTENIITKSDRRDRIYVALVYLGQIPFVLYPLTPWIDLYHVPMPDWVRWLGGFISLTGIAGFYWSHHALGKNWAIALEIKKEHALVTDGPYRFVRHPMYAAIYVIAIGLSLLSANWLIAVVFLIPFTLMYLVRVPSEEEMMLEYFGAAYRNYMTKTGRLIPRFRATRHTRPD